MRNIMVNCGKNWDKYTYLCFYKFLSYSLMGTVNFYYYFISIKKKKNIFYRTQLEKNYNMCFEICLHTYTKQIRPYRRHEMPPIPAQSTDVNCHLNANLIFGVLLCEIIFFLRCEQYALRGRNLHVFTVLKVNKFKFAVFISTHQHTDRTPVLVL